MNEHQIITVNLNSNDLEKIKPFVAGAVIGGKSSVRNDEKERQENLVRDQVVGLFGLYAYNIHTFGHCEYFTESRKIADANPNKGDGGQDIPNTNIDVKTSFIKPDSIKPITHYNLCVREEEEHEEWVYILALVNNPVTNKNVRVHLMGWATTSMLPKEAEQRGIFKGAKIIKAYNLNPLPPFRWGVKK